MHGTPARNVSTRRKGPRPETRRRDLFGRDRDETRDAQVRDRDETETLSTLSETRPRRRDRDHIPALQAFLSITRYLNFFSACAVTVVIFRHLNRSFHLLTYLLTYFLTLFHHQQACHIIHVCCRNTTLALIIGFLEHLWWKYLLLRQCYDNVNNNTGNNWNE